MRVGDYEVGEQLGSGGMGAVFRARDAAGRDVALKLLQGVDDDARFAREAEAAARLDHPRIARIHAFAQHAGRPYLVMELVPGQSLKARMADGPLPVARVVELGLELCDALSHAHARGVLHRDLKPHNVLLTPAGHVKLVDFGLARIEDQSQRLTQTGELLGTPAYMPPEQATGDVARVGPTSDVYGLGATLYAMLCGRAPFTGKSTFNVLHAVLDKDPDPPSLLRPEVPPALEQLVLDCLRKDPAQRPQTVEAVAAALRASPPQAASAAPAGARLGWLALVTACVAVGLVAALVADGGSPPPPPPTPSRVEPTAPQPDPAAEQAAREARDALEEILKGPDDSTTLRALHAHLTAHPGTANAAAWRRYAALAAEQPYARYQSDDAGSSLHAVFAGQRILTLAQRGQLAEWDPETGRVRVHDGPPGLREGSLVMRGDQLWASGKQLRVFTWPPDQPPSLRERFDLPPASWCLALSPDGRRLAVEVRDGLRAARASGTPTLIVEYDLLTGRERRRIPLLEHGPLEVLGLTYTPDSETLLIGGESAGHLPRLLSLPQDGPWVALAEGLPAITRFQFDPPRGRLFVGTESGEVLRIDPETFARIEGFSNPADAEEGEGQLRVVEVLNRLPAHGSSVRGLALSPNGERIYSAASSGSRANGHPELRIWSVDPPTYLSAITLSVRPWTISLSPDGRFLLIDSQDTAVELWLVDPLVPRHSD